MKCPISPDEFDSLQRLTNGSVRERINSRHAERLVALGFARETADGVTITKRGLALLNCLRVHSRRRPVAARSARANWSGLRLIRSTVGAGPP